MASVDLTGLEALELSALIGRGGVSAAEVMAAFLDRIERVNPGLNAIVSLRPRDELMAEAKAADAGPRRGWLHGMPVAVKDLVATQGITTTWGSPLYARTVPAQDELLAARLRADGAILIGKTNVPEFGLGSHTFNPVFGPSLNPWDRSRTPGGSSGGAAAALAARLLPVADGSDAMGSLRNPAGFCNIYSLRPTVGLVPGEPQGEMFFATLSTDGPMARTPRDVAALLATLAGPDPRRPYGRAVEDWLGGIEADLTGRRIGWLGDWGGALPFEPGIQDLCRSALEGFGALGVEVEEVAPPYPLEKAWTAWTTLRSWALANRYRDFWSDPEKRQFLKPALAWEIERGLAMTADQIWEASVIRSDLFRALARAFETYDALALPTAQVWPFPVEWVHPQEIAGVKMDTYHRWMQVVVPVSLTGVPAMTVPAGFGTQGLPMGIQLFGAAGSEARLLQLAEGWHGIAEWAGREPAV